MPSRRGSAARAPTRRRRPGPGSRESTGWRWTSWSSARASCGPSATAGPRRPCELVPDAVHRIVAGLQFAKTMRWPGGRFSRPIRWLVVKLDDELVEMEVAGVASGGESRGHRSLGAVRVGSAASYLEDLRGVHVLADAAERRELIVEGLNTAGEWIDPMGKLDEVVHLVEWPTGARRPVRRALPGAARARPDHRHAVPSALLPDRPRGARRRPLRVRRERRRRGGGRGRERGGAGGAAGGCRLRARQGSGPRHRRDAGRAAPRQLPGGGGVAGRQG